MRKSIPSARIIKSEAFQLFFEDKLDKKMQHADLKELAEFVFGSLSEAIRRFNREKEDWEAILQYKNP